VPQNAQVSVPIANMPTVIGPAVREPVPAAAIGTPAARAARPYSSVATAASRLAPTLTSHTGRARRTVGSVNVVSERVWPVMRAS